MDVIERALLGGFAFPVSVVGFEAHRVVTLRLDLGDCRVLRYLVRTRLVTRECRTACCEYEDAYCRGTRFLQHLLSLTNRMGQRNGWVSRS